MADIGNYRNAINYEEVVLSLGQLDTNMCFIIDHAQIRLFPYPPPLGENVMLFWILRIAASLCFAFVCIAWLRLVMQKDEK